MQTTAQSILFFLISVLVMETFKAVFLLHVRNPSQLTAAAK